MSAVLQVPVIWGGAAGQTAWPDATRYKKVNRAQAPQPRLATDSPAAEPVVSLAFYRKHTEKILRRYLYASMQVGRAPSILAIRWAGMGFEPSGAHLRRRCHLRARCGEVPGPTQLLDGNAEPGGLQEYTQAEAAVLLGMSARAISYKFPQALDRLTQ